VNQKIPDRDEAELRLAVQVGEPSAASRVFDGTPASRAPLTLLPAREATGVAWHCKKRMKKDETTLDSADDVIHGNWPTRPFSTRHDCFQQSSTALHRVLSRILLTPQTTAPMLRSD
jgi:hypothetical protein